MRFSSAIHSRSQFVQIHKGTRDDQQSHFLLEETFSEDEHKVCVCTEMTTNAHPQLKTSMENLVIEVAKLFAQVSHQVHNDSFRGSEEIDSRPDLEATAENSQKG